MTTLPQNLSTRMARPPGAPPAGLGGPTTASGMTGADVVRVLRGSVWVLLGLIVLSAIVGYFVNGYLARYKSRYTATGYLEIRPSATANPLGRGQSGADQASTLLEQRTQVQTMRSEALFSKVLQIPDSKIRETQWFKSFNGNASEARQDLMQNFSVNGIPETRLIQVSMQYSKPDDTRVIVEEVVEEHLRAQRQAALDANFVLSEQLRSMKVRAEADLRQVAEDRREAATQLSNLGVSPTQSINVSQPAIELDLTTKRLDEAQGNLASAKNQLDQIQQAAAAGQEPAIITQAVEADPQVAGATQDLRAIENQIQALEQMGIGTSSKQLQDLRSRKTGLETRVDELRKEMITKKKTQLIENLQSAVKAGEATVKQLSDKNAELQRRMADISNLYNRFTYLLDRERQLQANLLEINENLNPAGGAALGSSSITWASGGHPIPPEIPSFPKLGVTLSVAITLGLGLGLVLAFAKELLDTTIRSPRDVAKVGPLAVLGMIPHEDDDPQSAGARLPLVIAEAPQSMTAENLRQFRTRLQHAASLDTTRSLMVTSPNPGDGKTTVAANLAAGLALVGRRILLVDANFRRPELHKLFNLDNTQGFSTALSAPAQIQSLAKATKIPNLSVLATGPKPANATELLESALLHDFIEKALESYDHIIFDSGPILFASESVAMAPRVDGVITVVRARQSTRGVLGRVRETLRQIKAENLGVVINGIRAYGGGYYSRNIKTYYEYAANGNG